MDTLTNSSAHRRALDRPSSRQRSRVGNGSGLLPRGLADERSAWARRLKDCIADHLADAPNASAAERSLLRRAAVLTVELERLEAKFAAAGEATTPDLETYQRCSNSLRRLLESVGLKRRAKDITDLSLGEVLRQGIIDHDRGA
jgi:hypothetical protein